MGHYDIAHDLDVDAEVLVHENISKPSNLWPCDFGMCVRDCRGEMIHSLADDLKIPLNGVHRHIRESGIVIQ